jgi:precorrin-6A/cobalt-precorrin-6A reductase
MFYLSRARWNQNCMTSQTQTCILLLGGTTEATALAERLAHEPRITAVLSLAGRTANPAPSALPVRVGGFGGVDGLAAYIQAERIDLVIDATHPFASQMSANAVAACHRTGCHLIAIERAPWVEQDGDRWQHFESVTEAVAALPHEPQRVFSGLGRLLLAELEAAPQHHYVIRLIDPPTRALALPNLTIIRGKGPFKTADDRALFAEHSIAFVLAKNAGGRATVSKIEAARALGLTVMMIDRPSIPARPTVETVDQAWQAIIRAIDDGATTHVRPSLERGV